MPNCEALELAEPSNARGSQCYTLEELAKLSYTNNIDSTIDYDKPLWITVDILCPILGENVCYFYESANQFDEDKVEVYV